MNIWRQIWRLVPNKVQKSNVIVKDREKAVCNLNSQTLVYCCNHILSDPKQGIKQNGEIRDAQTV